MKKTDDIWPGLYDSSKGQKIPEVTKLALGAMDLPAYN